MKFLSCFHHTSQCNDAARVNRELLWERFGKIITRHLEHTAAPLRKSVLCELEREFATDFARTQASRFRASTDISVTNSLYHYYALMTGRAVQHESAKVLYVVDADNPYPRQFTGHLRVTLKTGEVREASQGHFRGGREEPMSAEALEEKFTANCIYGGWDADRARRALAVLRALRAAPRVDLSEVRG